MIPSSRQAEPVSELMISCLVFALRHSSQETVAYIGGKHWMSTRGEDAVPRELANEVADRGCSWRMAAWQKPCIVFQLSDVSTGNFEFRRDSLMLLGSWYKSGRASIGLWERQSLLKRDVHLPIRWAKLVVADCWECPKTYSGQLSSASTRSFRLSFSLAALLKWECRSVKL